MQKHDITIKSILCDPQRKDEQSKGDLFKIYQQQQMLRQELEDAIKESGKGTKEAKNVIKSMEQLENGILEKGFNK